MPDHSADQHEAWTQDGAEAALAEIASLWPDRNVWDERVILQDGAPIGHLSVRAVAANMLWIGEIYLAAGRERQGLGSALLDQVCAVADRFQCDIALEALWRPGTTDGGWLARWYESRGFAPTTERDEDNLVVFRRPAAACEPGLEISPE